MTKQNLTVSIKWDDKGGRVEVRKGVAFNTVTVQAPEGAERTVVDGVACDLALNRDETLMLARGLLVAAGFIPAAVDAFTSDKA